MPNTYNLPADATLAPRTDGSTVKFVVTAAQEIDVYEDLELYEVPAGDFMSDGSVPMRGDIVFEIGAIATPLGISNGGGTLKVFDQGGGPKCTFNDSTGEMLSLERLALGIRTTSIDIFGAPIHNVVTPAYGTDAATKNYVDTEIAAIPPGGTGDFMADGSVPMTNDIIVPSGTIITSVLDQYTSIDCDGASWVFKINGGQPLSVTKTLTTLTTELHLNNNKIINLLDPVDPQDAATKNYVDTSIGAIPPGGTGDFMADGSVPMTGTATVLGVDLIQSSTEFLAVDSGIRLYIHETSINLIIEGTDVLQTNNVGFNLQVPLTMGDTNKITRLADPVDAQDAATKAYVDTGDGVLLAKIDTLETKLEKAMALITALQIKVDAL